MGGAIVHIKGCGSTPIPHQRQISTEGIGGHYPLSMLGRILLAGCMYSVHVHERARGILSVINHAIRLALHANQILLLQRKAVYTDLDYKHAFNYIQICTIKMS